jgi:hypothetical protein
VQIGVFLLNLGGVCVHLLGDAVEAGRPAMNGAVPLVSHFRLSLVFFGQCRLLPGQLRLI